MREVNPACGENKLGRGITVILQHYPWAGEEALSNSGQSLCCVHAQACRVPLFE